MTSKITVYPFNLLDEFVNVDTPIWIHIDCDPARFILENRVNNKRTLHLAVKYRYVTELVENGFFKLVREKGTDLIADVGTKPLTRQQLEKWCRIIFNTENKEILIESEFSYMIVTL